MKAAVVQSQTYLLRAVFALASVFALFGCRKATDINAYEEKAQPANAVSAPLTSESSDVVRTRTPAPVVRKEHSPSVGLPARDGTGPVRVSGDPINGVVRWDRWRESTAANPEIWLVSEMTAETLELAREQVFLAQEIVAVTPDQTPAPSGPNIGQLLRELQSRFPSPTSARYRIERGSSSPVQTLSVQRPDFYEKYRRKVAMVAVNTLSASLSHIESDLKSDLRMLDASAGRVTRSSFPHYDWIAPNYVDAQAHASASWLRGPFQSYLSDLRRISGQVPARSPASPKSVQALSAWTQFEQSRYPVLTATLRRTLIRSAPIREDGSFHISGAGFLVVRAQVGSKVLFFPRGLEGHGFDVAEVSIGEER